MYPKLDAGQVSTAGAVYRLPTERSFPRSTQSRLPHTMRERTRILGVVGPSSRLLWYRRVSSGHASRLPPKARHKTRPCVHAAWHTRGSNEFGVSTPWPAFCGRMGVRRPLHSQPPTPDQQYCKNGRRTAFRGDTVSSQLPWIVTIYRYLNSVPGLSDRQTGDSPSERGHPALPAVLALKTAAQGKVTT